jgi:hypothetical protein
MKSSKLLAVGAMAIWYAVVLTAAPKAFSHRRAPATAQGNGWPATTCADLHVNYGDREAVVQSEERSIPFAEARSLRIQPDANGGLQVEGWEKDSYSVMLCKVAEAGPDAESLLSQIHLTLQNGQLGVSGPGHGEHWSAHLLVHAPKIATLDLSVKNGPMTLSNLSGDLKVRGVNGPITVSNCTGELELTAKNGPVTLDGNSGKQTVDTENGPLDLSLAGSAWNGSGLEAHAKNGPVTLRIPSGYQSGVVLEAENRAPFLCTSSVCSEGRKTWDDEHRRIEFGNGPAVVRISTVNGPVSVH